MKSWLLLVRPPLVAPEILWLLVGWSITRFLSVYRIQYTVYCLRVPILKSCIESEPRKIRKFWNIANRKEISKSNSFLPIMNIDIEIKIFFPKIEKRFSEKNLFSQDRKENLNRDSISLFGKEISNIESLFEFSFQSSEKRITE